jgi:phage-related protein
LPDALPKNLNGNSGARILIGDVYRVWYVNHQRRCLRNQMVLLHGFIKKTQRMPDEDLTLARKRLKEIEK